MSAKEGLYANLFLDGITHAGTMGTQSPIILLTGIELSWTQGNTPFHGLGSLQPASILRGCIGWEGRFKKAYTDNKWLGTFNIGTYQFAGSLNPAGTTVPMILGTVVLTGGSLSNMDACSEAAVNEDQGFIIYGLTFKDA